MLSVILLILKIIGITLLILIGLLLAILLTVLIVPIRYRVQGEHGEEKLYIGARVSWLLHLVGVTVNYAESILHIRIRVLWITLYDNQNPKVKRSKKKNPRATKQSRKKTENKNPIRKSVKSSTNEETAEANRRIETKKEVLQEEIKPSGKPPEPMIREETLEKVLQDEPGFSQVTSFFGKIKEKIDKIRSRLISIWSKIIGIKQKIVALFRGIKARIIKWGKAISNIKQKIDLIHDFIKDEVNREGFGVIFVRFKRLLKHIMPTKLQSRIVFGTGDPCSTGQALAVMSIIYSFYGDKVSIIPDFENKVLKGKHDARGRIRLATLLVIVIKLLLDKRFQKLKDNFLILKEAL